MPADAPDDTPAAPADAPAPRGTAALDRARDAEPAVVFTSPFAGWSYVANLAAGAVACALIGALLGFAVGRPVSGAVLGVIVAVSGALFARGKGEVAPRAIEVSRAERSARIVLGGGREVLLDARAGAEVGVEATGDADAAQTHWVVVRRPERDPLRVRARDADEAARVAAAIRDAIDPPAEPAERA